MIGRIGSAAGTTARNVGSALGGAPSRWNWRVAARCRTADAEALFVRGAEQRKLRDFCGSCPVRTECLAHALDERIEHGVWGGTTERERRALLRSRPGVASWAELLGAARAAHYSPGGTRIRSAAEETVDALLDLVPGPAEARREAS